MMMMSVWAGARQSGIRWRGNRVSRLRNISTQTLFKVSDEVQHAIHSKKPVVALETTIYTHGFPYPENIALASHLESVVRVNGGVPATIGVLNGVARVGLAADELIELAASAGRPETRKLSRRDIGHIVGLGISGRRLNGGTTISGTMVLAHLAGIKVFATGGLGGVHRGGEDSMDISADLTELGRTPVAVISSGCKSFLDIPRTLEYLETQGAMVGTFRDDRMGTVDFPAFWTRESGIRSPLTIDHETEAAAIIYAQSALNINSGMLFANPIPSAQSIPKARMDSIIAEAVDEAERSGALGSDNTPFVLKKIRELTKGETIEANKVLIEGNVARGTKVATELMKLELGDQGIPELNSTNNRVHNKPIANHDISSFSLSPNTQNGRAVKNVSGSTKEVDIVVAGSLAIDLSCDFSPLNSLTPTPHPGTSNPARIAQNLGGVGQNVATAIHRLDRSVILYSAVGDDVAGRAALEMLAERGLETSGIKMLGESSRTAQYVAVNDTKKDLVLAMADMTILEDPKADFTTLWKPEVNLHKPKWLVVDANWNARTLKQWIGSAKASGTKVAFDPVSLSKSTRLFDKISEPATSLEVIPNHVVDLTTPNETELSSMFHAARDAGLFDRQDWWDVIDSLGMPSMGSRDKIVSITNSALVDRGVPQQSLQLLPFIPCVLTKLGAQGVLITQLLRSGDDRLISPSSAPNILCRAKNDQNVVGGVYMRLMPPAEEVLDTDILSVNGVGDTFLGIIIAGLAKENPHSIPRLVNIAQQGSVMTLKSKEAVSPDINELRLIL